MNKYAVSLLIVALIAGGFGFFVVVGIAAMIAKVLFGLLLVLFLVCVSRRRRSER